MEEDKNYFKAVSYLPQNISRPLAFLENTRGIEEIRIRRNLPIALTVRGEIFFLNNTGQTSKERSENTIYAKKDEVEETFYNLCNNSVYAHEKEIKEGFITAASGIRAGICGNFTEEGVLREIYSVNIRIARQIFGCSEGVLEGFSGGGILITGPPGSGKTTLLRDLVRNISKNHRVTVVDTRGEISGGYTNDLGPNTDVIVIRNKAKGMEMAVRTMFPRFVAFDEIGDKKELEEVKQSFKTGVSVITTAHIENINQLKERHITRNLLNFGGIERVVVLSPDKMWKIYSPKEIIKNDFN